MKIVLGQMNVLAGQMSLNVNKMLDMIGKAKKEKADLIVFPELCVTGYLLADKWMDQNFVETALSYNEVLKKASEGIGIIWGNVATFKDILGRDGRHVRCNTAYFAYNNNWVKKENDLFDGRYIKCLNPDYRIFDDSRYFLSALELSKRMKLDDVDFTSPFLFEKDDHTYRIGLEICEDLWSQDYQFDPTSQYLNQNVDFIVNISSSPWTRNKEKGREKQILRYAQHDFVPFVYVNAVGMQNNSKTVCVFDGDSSIYNEKGERIASCNDSFLEECKIIELNETSLADKCQNKLTKALITAIREFDQQVFQSRFKWIIGLSGGLDSSVNAALLTLSLGKERVIGLNMATRYNSSATIDNAHKLAHALGIECRDGIIQKLVEEQIECLKQYTQKEISEFAIENIQARIRGSILSAISQIENGVVINNGNKIEGALGYATLYGDTIGCLAPLQDVTKVELFEIARSINESLDKEVIPYNLLPEIENDHIKWETPPSAELKNNQLDPMKWFYHDQIIQILTEYPGYGIEKLMQQYLDKSIYETELGKWILYYGLDDPQKFIEDLEWVLQKFQLGVFKRLQTPPIVMVSRGCFGSDFRENQVSYEKSNTYLALKEAILAHANQ
ncbi:NAD(+) synthase [Traorella massiliensis]|uniref:NAD(+) synthase n=1 Tax=Traorella massiliensis TaxID=1903263 RepID=UPI00248F3141|nr:NAD(+) synthase [Traorella massiliensis]